MKWRSFRWFLLSCVLLAAAFAPLQPAGARETPAWSGSSVKLADLPLEAREVLARIQQGGPFRYAKDGSTFFNREGLLPRRPRGHYTEYTVRTPGASDRGARRIIAVRPPAVSGEYYYTDDHYRSFRRIRE